VNLSACAVQAGKRAVVLLSGGLDSVTAAAMAKAEGYTLHALTFCYGQRHVREVHSAKRIATAIGVIRHLILDLDLRQIGGSALTAEIPVPKGRGLEEIGAGIPVTYVPARNTIFLSYALALAEVTGSEAIVLGVNAIDYSGYPDCRPEYIAAFEQMANLATKTGIEGRSKLIIYTPLIHLTKAEIVRQGAALGVDFQLTWSCYDPTPDGQPCGTCDSCILRARGFAEAGIQDPGPAAL